MVSVFWFSTQKTGITNNYGNASKDNHIPDLSVVILKFLKFVKIVPVSRKKTSLKIFVVIEQKKRAS